MSVSFLTVGNKPDITVDAVTIYTDALYESLNVIELNTTTFGECIKRSRTQVFRRARFQYFIQIPTFGIVSIRAAIQDIQFIQAPTSRSSRIQCCYAA